MDGSIACPKAVSGRGAGEICAETGRKWPEIMHIFRFDLVGITFISYHNILIELSRNACPQGGGAGRKAARNRFLNFEYCRMAAR